MSKAIERLRQQRDQIEMRLQQAEARQKQAKRKQDVRRKILIGAWYLSQAEENGNYDELVRQMDSFLTRNSDRKLFDLPALAS